MLLSLASITLYLFLAVFLGIRLLRSDPAKEERFSLILMGATALGAVLHGAVLYRAIPMAAGFDLGIANVLSLVSWGIVLVLLFGALARPLMNVGVLVFPLAAAALTLALFFPGRTVAPEQLPPGVEVHVILSVLAASVLTIAALQSVFLAFQERSLRRKRPGRIPHLLPPLQIQESIFFQLIGGGFFLLSLSLASGMAFIEDMFAQHLAHKTILSVSAWTVFAILLWGRWRFGWRGRRAVRWSLAGFVVLMLAYFGSKWVLEGILGRTWY
uniref:ABC-type uncharacterized transport system, permease component n=1 Tax=Candidatus Kentrum sp. DK TaxID=2126562 RepID=A0A450RW90_9GAMM|nr:MAG: ABC-type uncharacterized transport system, permease component [Candidatus Kentron sp. DK]VFJ58680.1 MAG: ABC-type uncharacterized transport system, permease component [Candidatus Kentron sp. DK]